MSYTIAEQAWQDAFSAIEGVSTAAGFNTDPIVEAKGKEAAIPADGKWVCMGGDPVERPGAPMGFEEVEQPFVVECFHLPTNADTTMVRTRLSQMAGDVRKKLREDPQRGGYAIYTKLNKPDVYNDAKPPFFVRIEATLWVRHRLNDPYTQF